MWFRNGSATLDLHRVIYVITSICDGFWIKPLVRSTVFGILEDPKAKDIIQAFDAVRDAIRLGVDVNKTSKKLVVQTIKYDLASLEYMFQILNVGPFLERVGDRVSQEIKMHVEIHRICEKSNDFASES